MPHREDSTCRLGTRSVRATNHHPVSFSDDVKHMPTAPREALKSGLHLANLSSSLVAEECALRSKMAEAILKERRNGRLPLKS